jgi:uncharacterized protein YaaW (UPF0174 family)
MDNVGILLISASEFFPANCRPASLPLIEDDELVSLLERAAESELDGLVQCLVKKGGITCQLKHLKVFKENSPHHRAYTRDIAAEIQKYGANTLVSQAFRSGRGVRYEEIVRDVASRLGLPSRTDVRDIETSILENLLEKLWLDQTPSQRRALLEELNIRDLSLAARATLPAAIYGSIKLSGFWAYKASVIVANAAAKVLLGHGLSFVANAALTKSLSIVINPPVGLSVVGLLTAHSIAGEAYRVTVPCVLQVSMIRRAVAERDRSKRKQREGKLLMILFILIPLLFAMTVRYL